MFAARLAARRGGRALMAASCVGHGSPRSLLFVRRLTTQTLSETVAKSRAGEVDADLLAATASTAPPSTTATAAATEGNIPRMGAFKPGYTDTHQLYKRLSEQFSPKQAEIVTDAITHHARVCTNRLEEELLSVSSYQISRILYEAELKSVRSELRMQEKSQFLSCKADLSQLEREITAVDQSIREALTTLRTNMNIELNTHKIVLRDDTKRHERSIAETNHKLQAELSELKTEIEVGKLDIIKYSLVSILIILLVLVAFFNAVGDEPPPAEVIIATGD